MEERFGIEIPINASDMHKFDTVRRRGQRDHPPDPARDVTVPMSS